MSDMTDMSGMSDGTSTDGVSMTMKMYFHGSIGTDMLWFSSWMPTSAGATVGAVIGLFLLAIFERYLVAFRRACDVAWGKGKVGFVSPTSTGRIVLGGNGSGSVVSSTTTSAGSATRRVGTPTPMGTNGSSTPTGSAGGKRRLSDDPEKTVPEYTATPTDDEEALEDQEGLSHLPRAARRTARRREGRWSRPWVFAVDVPRGFLQALQTLIHYLLMLAVMSFQIWWVIGIVIGAGVGECLFGRFGSGMQFDHHHA